MRASFVLLMTVCSTVLLAGCTQPDDGANPTTSSASPSKGSPTSGSSGYGAPEPMHVHVGSGTFDAPATSLALGTRVDFHAHQAGHTVTIHVANSTVPTMVDEEPAADEIVDVTFGETGTYYVYCRYHSDGENGDYSHGMALTLTVG